MMIAYSELVLVLSICLGLTAACGEDGWINGPYGCYKFVMKPTADWKSAEALCRKDGGSLAVLETENEIFWMKGYRSHHSDLRVITWVGGQQADGKWYWVNDSPMGVTDWAAGQPDNPGKGQDCLALFGNTVIHGKPADEWFRFDNDGCGISRPYICEKPLA